jgi:hypothetical protein
MIIIKKKNQNLNIYKKEKKKKNLISQLKIRNINIIQIISK